MSNLEKKARREGKRFNRRVNKFLDNTKDAIGLGGGQTEPLKEFKPSGLNSPGLTVTPDGEIINISRTPETERILAGLAGGFNQQALDTRDLLDRVRPGFGGLTQAISQGFQERRSRLEQQRESRLGNLREEFARRRLAGSSFAEDTATRTELDFRDAEDRLDAEENLAQSNAFLKEIEMTNQLLTQANDAAIKEFTVLLNQLNFETNIGAQISSGVTTALAANAQLQAQLLNDVAERRSGVFGEFLGEAMNFGIPSAPPVIP